MSANTTNTVSMFGIPGQAFPAPPTGTFGLPAPPPPETLAQAQAAGDAATAKNLAAQTPVTSADWSKLSQMLQSGNFDGAWKYAAGFGKAAQVTGKFEANPLSGFTGSPAFMPQTGTNQANPLMQALLSPQGLQQLAPNMQWTPQNTAAFYSAAKPVWNSDVLGQNPSGQWGDPAKLAADATTNSQAGTIPDITRYGGMRTPDGALLNFGSNFSKVATPIILGLATGGIGSALGGGMLGYGAAGAMTGAVGGVQNGPSGMAKGALMGGITGALGGSGLASSGKNLLTDVYGVPQAVAGSVVQGGIGAGVGALRGAVGGTGAGRGALQGGLTGAIQGGLQGAFLGSNNQAPLTGLQKGAIGAASGAVPGIINGNLGQGIVGGAAGAAGTVSPGLGIGVGMLANNLLGSHTRSSVGQPMQGNPAPATATPAQTTTTSTATGTTAPTMSNTQPTNIGAYPGLGYQPRQQVQNPVTNYNTYGQGPEASFFQPIPGT